MVYGPAIVGIGSDNGQFGLGDDGVLGITVLIKELDAYGMPLGFPGDFSKLLVRMVPGTTPCVSVQLASESRVGRDRCHPPVTAAIVSLRLSVHHGRFLFAKIG